VREQVVDLGGGVLVDAEQDVLEVRDRADVVKTTKPAYSSRASEAARAT